MESIVMTDEAIANHYDSNASNNRAVLKIEHLVSSTDDPINKRVRDADETSDDIVVKSEEVPSPRSNKKSRKYQGIGLKKPIYSKYESLFIIKAYQKILERRPNLVRYDIFNIISVLHDQESRLKGFKRRSPDQLYQKFKRIQHSLKDDALASDQVDFHKFFKKNEFNEKEWIPIEFENIRHDSNGDVDDDYKILETIKLEQLDVAIEEVLGRKRKIGSDLHASPSIDEPEEGKSHGERDNIHGLSDSEKTIRLLEQQIDLQNDGIKTLQKVINDKDLEISFLKKMIEKDLEDIRHKIDTRDDNVK